MSVSVWSLKRKGSFHYLLPNISPYTPYISLVLSTLLFHTHAIHFRHLIFHTSQDVEYFVHEESTSLSLPCDDGGDILYQQMACFSFRNFFRKFNQRIQRLGIEL